LGSYFARSYLVKLTLKLPDYALLLVRFFSLAQVVVVYGSLEGGGKVRYEVRVSKMIKEIGIF
jgi:hypothetical protein